MIRLPATPLPDGAHPGDPSTWGDPMHWPTSITTVAVPHVAGGYRGKATMTVVACDPGAQLHRISCGILQPGNKTAPAFVPWGYVGNPDPAHNVAPRFFAQNWPAINPLSDGTCVIFVDYAAPAAAWSLGGLDIAIDYEH